MAQEQGVDIADVAESGMRIEVDDGSDGGRRCQKDEYDWKSKKTKANPESSEDKLMSSI